MPACLLLVSPGANRVYGAEAPRLAAAELALTAPWALDVRPERLAGVDYVAFGGSAPLGPDERADLARQSCAGGLFEVVGAPDEAAASGTTAPDVLLRPCELPDVYRLPDDLVTIPKYQGKTNERFTHLLVHLTLAAAGSASADATVATARRPSVLDPLAGRGTTLLTAWRFGCDACGVEADEAAFDALGAYVTTYLRRTRTHHTAATTPVRREGRRVGRRYDACVAPDDLRLTVFTGDTRDSAALYGKRRFDAIVTDAPYGVVHGARSGAGRERSPALLLREALPVWAGQLRSGGALGLAWNTYGLRRDELLGLLTECGLVPRTGGTWNELSHRVDSSIVRDVVVAVKPA